MEDCLFCKIVQGKIPSKKVYEDEHTFAFEDVDPKAPTHVLIVPKKHFAGLKEATVRDAEIIWALSSDCREDRERPRDRRRLPHRTQCRPEIRAVGFPPARSPDRRTRPALATWVIWASLQ